MRRHLSTGANMGNGSNVLFTFFVVTAIGSFARYTVQTAFKPKYHLTFLFLAIFFVAFLHSSAMYHFPLLERMWRSGAVAVTAIFAFYGFRFLVIKYESRS